jgi:pyruvate dehydrogenase E2 component (dihydrolipoamide acetyltransferase)
MGEENMESKHISFDLRQRVISSSTSLGWTAPHVAYIYEADATGLMVEFDRLKHLEINAKKIALNTVLLKIIVEGIKAAPEVNAHVLHSKWLSSGHVKIIDGIDINMPILLADRRMMTVKLPDAGNKSLAEITMYLDQLMNKVQNTNIDIALLNVSLEDTKKQVQRGNLFNPIGRIIGANFGKNKLKNISQKEKEQYQNSPKELRLSNDDINLGTVTISNLGSSVRGTNGMPTLIDLISPQVMAVGIGPLQEKPIVCGGQIISHKIIPFCIVFDHRALDFGNVAPFINQMDSVFKKPDVIHTW